MEDAEGTWVRNSGGEAMRSGVHTRCPERGEDRRWIGGGVTPTQSGCVWTKENPWVFRGSEFLVPRFLVPPPPL